MNLKLYLINSVLFFISLVLFADDAVFTGTLEPSEKEIITSKCEAVMMKNADEGSLVNKGDVIYQLDTAEYEEQKIAIESELRKLAAEQKVNKLSYENRLIEARQKVISKKINHEIATLNADDLNAGANPAEVKVSEEKVRLAELVFENSKVELELIKKLVEGGYVSKDELNALEFKIQSEEEALKLLKKEHELIKQGPTSIQKEEAKILMEIRKKELENTESQLNALSKGYDELIQYQTREYKNRNRKLDRVNKNIADCVAYAPISGTVFYERFPWGEKIPTGKIVWDGLNVRSVANLTNMNVKIKIPVESISNFAIGQKAKIVIFATGKVVNGEISKISQIQEDEFADAHNKTKEVLGTSTKKVFVVRVKMLELMPNLKPGMTAKVIFESKNESEKK